MQPGNRVIITASPIELREIGIDGYELQWKKGFIMDIIPDDECGGGVYVLMDEDGDHDKPWNLSADMVEVIG